MKLHDYNDEIDDYEELDAPEKKVKVKTGLLTALLVVGICIAVMLLMIIGSVAYVYFTGQFTFKQSDNADKPIYTEAQVQEMLATANEDAEALMESKLSAATETGYALGRNDLLEFIRNTLLSTNSSLETFKRIYPEYLVVVSAGAYHFLPIDTSLALSELEADKVNVIDGGELQYLNEDGSVASYKGIDVSAFQGDVNWDSVKADGVEFAIVRTHYRGYGTGRLVEDDKAAQNIRGAMSSGIHVGAYVFSQAINDEEAIEEANAAISLVSPYATDIPIIIDVERIPGSDARADKISVETRTSAVLAFCKTVEEAGYKPMIYFNTEMGALYLDYPQLEGISKWYAWYGTSLYFPYDYDIWQYKDTGRVNGINGNVDMNIALKPFWE